MKLSFSVTFSIQMCLAMGVVTASNIGVEYDEDEYSGQSSRFLFRRGLFLKDRDGDGDDLEDPPTMAPVGQPTAAPIVQPTAAPTTAAPTATPTGQPTTAPSSQPTTAPSDQPTAAPSDQPSASPSERPRVEVIPDKGDGKSGSGVYNTGVDGKGFLLFGDRFDNHYDVVENDNLPARTLANPPVVYLPNGSRSGWIWQQSDGFPINVIRTFKTTFRLTGYDPTSAVLKGSWGSDDIGLDILINNVSTGITASGFGVLSKFTIGAGFQAEENVLEFKIKDTGTVGAFRLDDMSLKAAELP